MSTPEYPAAIDWGVHYPMIVKIIRRRAGICRDRGWEVDDLISGVVERILRKQQSENSRYDPTRGSLGTYVVRVTKGYISDLLDRAEAQVEMVPAVDDLPDPTEDEQLDGLGLDDEQRATLLGDTALQLDDLGLDDDQRATLLRALTDADHTLAAHRTGLAGVAYTALLAYLRHDRDTAALAAVTGLDEATLCRYLGSVVSTLRAHAAPELRPRWHALRQQLDRRRRKAERTPVEASGSPL